MLPDFEPKLIRVEHKLGGRSYLGVQSCELDVLLLTQVKGSQDFAMPVRCPPLVGDLRLHLWTKIEPLVANDGDELSLPLLEFG